MALRMSCLIHGLAFLLLLLGCAAHQARGRAGAADTEISEAKDFVVAVADKMPLWDADAISRYELVEIATVKADIAMAQQTEERAFRSSPTWPGCTTTGMHWSHSTRC